MSNISDIMAVDLEAIFDEIADAITYTQDGSDSVIQALLPPWVHEIVDEGEKEYADRRTTITIRTNTVTNPRPGDTVTIDSQTWNVVEISGQTFNEGFAHLNIIRQARTRIGGPGMKLARPAGGQAPFARKRV